MTKKRQLSLNRQRILVVFCFLLISVATGYYQLVYAANQEPEPVVMELDPNIGVKPYVEEFLKDNDAERLLSIIQCESNFTHFDKDGNVLQNRAGSSAVGVAQILSSVHPDPKLIARYNRRKNTNLIVDDLDITTLKGNLGYALILYELRGVKDWECAKHGW